jgi:5-oxoprolinase (ATP-hydrolysing)
MVGKIQPAHFPPIFGPGGDQKLDADVVREKFAALAQQVAAATGTPQDPRAVAEGFLRVAVANMAAAIKQVSIQKGHDVTRFALQCFGGAGGQHACLVADELGMDTVFIHPFAGVLSAYGMGLADQSVIREAPVEAPLTQAAMRDLQARIDALRAEAEAELLRQGAAPAAGGPGGFAARHQWRLRYAGTDTALPMDFPASPGTATDSADFAPPALFHAEHERRFGFAQRDRQIVVESLMVESFARGEDVADTPLPARQGGAAAPVLEEVGIFAELL